MASVAQGMLYLFGEAAAMREFARIEAYTSRPGAAALREAGQHGVEDEERERSERRFHSI
jgi:hypothetical protein